jgi:hypothetical protein
MRLAVGFVLILSLVGRDACAQWGYGGWGWGGWGGGTSTLQGDMLQGAANYAMGAGMYNLDTARARSINADTAMRYNEYVAQVASESAKNHAARVNQQFAKNQSLYDARQQQLRENPSKRDIETGDALNVAVADLSNPRLGSSALRAANIPVPASLIATIPFIYASERITLMLHDLRASVKWPEVFKEERFANDKKTFDDLAAKLRREADEGDVSAKSLREARDFVQKLRDKLQAQPLKSPDDQKEAQRFLTACTSLLGMLEKPNIGLALVELRRVKDTTLGSLLGFMHVYNLRFGAAKSPQEQQAYQRLFAILDQTRDQILAEAKIDPTATSRANSRAAIDFLQNLDQGRSPKGATTPPPKP